MIRIMYFPVPFIFDPETREPSALRRELRLGSRFTTLLCHQFRFGTCLGTGLKSPVEGALLPNVDVPRDQRRDEDHDLYERHRTENRRSCLNKAFKCHGEWDHEQDFDIE